MSEVLFTVVLRASDNRLDGVGRGPMATFDEVAYPRTDRIRCELFWLIVGSRAPLDRRASI